MSVSSSFFAFLMLCSLTISIKCAEQHEADADKNNCTDDLDKLHNYQETTALESQQMLHTMTTVEMYRAQREVAHYLEMAYLQLADHSDVAKEVRLTAHESRSQHLMTSGLMKQFGVTAVDIVKRKIPHIRLALKIKDPDIIKDILSKIIENAEQMKEETEKTQKDDASKERVRHEDNTFTFRPASGGFGFLLNMFGNVLNNIFGDNKKAMFYREYAKAYREADESVHRAMEGKRELLDKINAQRTEALVRVGKLKKMVREQVDLGDITGLQEADVYLGNVDKQFARISMYWENMAAVLKYLRDGVVSSGTFVHKISNPDVEKQFLEDLSATERDWRFFGKICSDYIEISDREVFKLYGFLSQPINNKSTEARRKRQEELIAQIEEDINSALPSMDDLD